MSIYEHLIPAAYRDVARAEDTHMSRPMAEVNKARFFDGKARADALQTWVANRCSVDSSFNAISFLVEYLEKYTKNVEALVVLALEYKSIGDADRAISNIDAALSARRYDLHTARISMEIRAWAKGGQGDDTDEWLKGRLCHMPFSNFDSMPNGDVFVCCGDWLPVPIGNIYQSSADEIWNSPVAEEIRASVIDGSYRYCSRLSCMDILNRTLAPNPGPAAKPALNSPGPSRIVLSHDNSCNLSCPSCRSEVILAKKEQQDRLNALLETVFVPLLKDATIVRISGSGDPFASNHYRALMKAVDRDQFPKLRIDLHTNAQLFDEKAWDELELRGKIWHVEISIDAATAVTYKVVRRGGSFERLKKNLALVRRLKQEGEIKELVFSFVVQQSNYLEMPEFVRLAEEFKADFVDFRMILNWGVTDAADFKRKCVGSPSHPEYEAYLAVLAQPELCRPNVRTPPRQ